MLTFPSVYNIWLFPKWYPNREDPQLGVFIQKHARAIALNNRVSVLYAHPLADLKNSYEIEQNKSDNVDEIIVYYKKSSGIFKSIINAARYVTAIRKGLKILHRLSPAPDILHAYILLRPAVVVWYLSKKMKVPFIVSEQWSGYVTGKYAERTSLQKYLTRKIISKASALTSVSKFLLDGMGKNGLKNSNSFITPNCIEISPAPSARRANQKLYVLIVADLVDEIKNISGVLRMISTLNEKPFELHIIGHGRDAEMLKELTRELKLNENVFFEGLKTNEEVYEYLHRCDFLLMNSKYETFSLICAEAMSCGKPVIATRCGGPDEFVTPETGILVEPGNQEELRSAFVKMINDYTHFDSLKIIAHATGLFSQKVVSEEFTKVFKTAIRRAK